MPEATQHHTDKKTKQRGHARKQRRDDERHAHTHAPRLSATELVKQPPKGWVASVHETSAEPESGWPRKRLRLLVLKGEYGWRVLPFMSVRVPRRTQTEGGIVEVMDDHDVLPRDVISAALEANLFTPNSLEQLTEDLGDLYEEQIKLPKPHERPLTQQPFAAKLNGFHIDSPSNNPIKEEEDVAKKSTPKPKKISSAEAWWYVAAVAAL